MTESVKEQRSEKLEEIGLDCYLGFYLLPEPRQQLKEERKKEGRIEAGVNDDILRPRLDTLLSQIQSIDAQHGEDCLFSGLTVSCSLSLLFLLFIYQNGLE